MVNEIARPEPYVGVSGMNSSWGRFGRQIAIESTAEDDGLLGERLLLEGVKVSPKTQMLDQENRFGRQYFPVGSELEDALRDHGDWMLLRERDARILRVAQVYMPPAGSADPGYRDRYMERILTRASKWIDGIQFDQLAWHTDTSYKDWLAELRREHNLKVILQCHGDAMDALGPEETVHMLGEYAAAGALDYILFDDSGGRGRVVDVEKMRQCLSAAFGEVALAGVGISIAGGLNGPVVRDIVRPLFEEFPIGCDAEARLRLMGPRYSYLDGDLTQDYIHAVSEVLGLIPQ